MTRLDREFTYEETIELNNDLSELMVLNQRFELLHTSGRINEKTLFYLTLIGDELITNIISYGFKDDLKHTIKLQLAVTLKDWTLKIEDDGCPFNPLEHAKPDLLQSLDERSIGGLGIHFVNQIMDEISYERMDNRNRISMKKYLA